MIGKFSAMRQKIVDRFVKIAFYLPIGRLRGEMVFFEKKIRMSFSFLSMEWRFFGFLSKFFPAKLSKMHTTCSWKQSEERIFIEGKDFDDQLPKLSKKLVAYCRNFSKACENGVLVVQRIKLTKISFSAEVCFVHHF